ncbi:thioredoxin family protein [Metabacillus malikii]|uniref:Thiol-disulfide isomerase/thioredoxin n=1 Tax=Metabacillus malikii TaxID=1504265 RepID=A0ABT9ZJD1_9BACI|nr:thioredoxin family protein [Metabacillus malikii]MDQ0232367.1 thiol-disulfide isomerase/thioredoxin [Metabacillus malikii]
MKKILIFGGIIVLLFASLGIMTTYQKNKQAEGNVYGTNNLKSSTVDLLDDPNYQNIILPDELDEKLANKEEVIVYFFSPECVHCKNATPELMPAAEDVGVKIEQYNVLEFEQAWTEFNIESTPTLIHFKDGKEVARTKGANTKEGYTSILTEWKS